MKRLVIGAAAAGGAAFAVRRFARKASEMHHHCREMMRDRCGQPSGDCQSS